MTSSFKKPVFIRNLIFVKTDFQILKLKFQVLKLKTLHKLLIYRVTLTILKILLWKLFVRHLVVKPACVNAAYRSVYEYTERDRERSLAALV